MATDFGFKASEKKSGYYFVSYNTEDSDRVAPICRYLHEAGFDIWYDIGIPHDSMWPSVIGSKVRRSAFFIIFITRKIFIKAGKTIPEKGIDEVWTYREYNIAKDWKDEGEKLIIVLDKWKDIKEVVPDALSDWYSQLYNHQGIYAPNESPKIIAKKIIDILNILTGEKSTTDDLTHYVKAACEGDAEAMARLFANTLKTSYYLASKLSEDNAAAVEITKEAYARAFCTVTKLKKPEAFEIWMKQNIVNIFKDGRTFNFSEAEGGAEETSMEFLSKNVIGNAKVTNAVLDSVNRLDTEKKTAILLHYFCGMPVSSMVKYFEVSKSTVIALLESAKAEIFENSGSEPPANVPTRTYPVLARLFYDEMAAFHIDDTDVREIYTYAKGIYDSFRKVDEYNKDSEIIIS